MARTSAPIHVIVYAPKTEEGKRELAVRAAGVHGDMVKQYIQKLNCPSGQKTLLLNAVIETAAREKAGVPPP
jgi:hypothetical protein